MFALAAHLCFRAINQRCGRVVAGRLLWPECDAEQQAASMRIAVHRMREMERCFRGTFLAFEEGEIRLDIKDKDCDALVVKAKLAKGRIEDLHDIDRAIKAGLLKGFDRGPPSFEANIKDLRARLSRAFAIASNESSKGHYGEAWTDGMIGLAKRAPSVEPSEPDATVLSQLDGRRSVLSAAANRSGEPSIPKRPNGLSETGPSPAWIGAAISDPGSVSPPSLTRTSSIQRAATAVNTIIRIAVQEGCEGLMAALAAELGVELWRRKAVTLLFDHASANMLTPGRSANEFELRLTSGLSPSFVSLHLVQTDSGIVTWGFSASFETLQRVGILAELAAELVNAAKNRSEADFALEESGVLTQSNQARMALQLLEGDELQAVRRGRSIIKTLISQSFDVCACYAALSRSFWWEWLIRGGDEIRLLGLAKAAAEKSINMKQTSEGLRELASTELYLLNYDRSLDLLGQSLEINPSDNKTKVAMIDALLSNGDSLQALSLAATITIKNNKTDLYFEWAKVSALFGLERYNEINLQLQTTQTTHVGYRISAAALSHLGEIEHARYLMQQYKDWDPSFDVDRWLNIIPIAKKRDRDNLSEGLRRAGF